MWSAEPGPGPGPEINLLEKINFVLDHVTTLCAAHNNCVKIAAQLSLLSPDRY